MANSMFWKYLCLMGLIWHQIWIRGRVGKLGDSIWQPDKLLPSIVSYLCTILYCSRWSTDVVLPRPVTWVWYFHWHNLHTIYLTGSKKNLSAWFRHNIIDLFNILLWGNHQVSLVILWPPRSCSQLLLSGSGRQIILCSPSRHKTYKAVARSQTSRLPEIW